MGMFSMEEIGLIKCLIRNPREWAADCRSQAESDIEVEAKDAFKHLAKEFEAAATEIDGLVSTFEALARRWKL
jgi:hypothetical protein